MKYQRKYNNKSWDINKYWPEYLYRELDEPECAQFAHYLHNSPEGKREEEQWREMLSRLDAMAVHDRSTEVPPELVFRVKRQVRLYEGWAEQTHTRVRRWLMGTAAACMIAALAGLFVYQQGPGWLSQSQMYQSWKSQALSMFYSEKTIELYQSEGMLGESKDENHEIVINPNETATEDSTNEDSAS